MRPKPPPMERNEDAYSDLWTSILAVISALIILLLVFGAIAVRQALAAPPANTDPNSPTAQWYRSLHLPGATMGCCSMADCRPVEARTNGDHWEAWYDDKWIAIPDDKIIRNQTNMEGRAVLCYMEQYGGGVLCFVPPAQV